MLEFLDTNIFVYALVDFRDLRKTSIARDLLRQVTARGTGVISTQVLKEFANTDIQRRTWTLDEAQVLKFLNYLCMFPLLTWMKL